MVRTIPLPAEIYRTRIERLSQAAAPLARLSDRIANARLAVALLGVGSLVAAGYLPFDRLTVLLCLIGTLLSGAAFVGLIVWHGRVHEERRRTRGLVRINSQSLARLERTWDKAPLP